MMTNNLVDVRRRMASAKKFDANWLLIGIPLAIVFLGWFMYESYQLHSGAFFNGLFWAGCIGGIVGAIWGFSLHFKTQRQYQDIIDQIEDLTAEN
jgi:membrane associated rhomboid family serine protease